MNFFRGLLFVLGVTTANILPAADNAISDEVNANILAGLQKLVPNIQIESVKPTPMQDIYQVILGLDVFYVSGDGRFVLRGDLLNIDGRRNLTEEARSSMRVDVLQKLDKKDYIEFAPEKTDYAIYVFTDIDCGYCRKLHRDVPELNKNGIAVRYLAFPRTGVDSLTGQEMSAVWCATDRKKAITSAKNDEEFAKRQCDNPVSKQYQLGQDLGVRGTPAIYLQDGTVLPGYVPPKELIQQVKS